MVVEVRVLDEGVHSGSAGGVVPSSFHILRQLLSRIEDESTGACSPRAARRHPDHPARSPPPPRSSTTSPPTTRGAVSDRSAHHRATADRPHVGAVARGGRHRWGPDAQAGGQRAAPVDHREAVGEDPTHRRPRSAADAIERRLTADPPYGATVTVTRGAAEPGWHAGGGPVASPGRCRGPRRPPSGQAPGRWARQHHIPSWACFSRHPVLPGPVRHHRGPGAGVQRPRAERVPAPAADSLQE